jgi:hypothetical protein
MEHGVPNHPCTAVEIPDTRCRKGITVSTEKTNQILLQYGVQEIIHKYGRYSIRYTGYTNVENRYLTTRCSLQFGTVTQDALRHTSDWIRIKRPSILYGIFYYQFTAGLIVLKSGYCK